MRAMISRRGASVLLGLALLLLVATGCGDKTTSTASSPEAGATVAAAKSAEQIVKDSEAKMAAVSSASFTADFSLQVQGDTSKMSDPTAQALLAQGVTVHAEGKSASEPTAVDMTVSLGIAQQNLEFGMKAKGSKSWVEYQGTWYALDAKNAKALSDQAQSGAAPTEQLKGMGIDPSSWGTSYTLVGTQDLNGVQVYHVKATADPQKLAEALTKAAQDPKLAKKFGASTGELGQLSQGLTKQDKKQVEELSESLKDASVDYWIGVDDELMYKAQFAASMDTSEMKDAQGVTGVTMDGTVTMADFDQPVEVTAPKGAQSFKKLMTQLFGGMLGGSGTSF